MIFRFKQFDIKHSESLLKVNTDAVLLGALVQPSPNIKTVLDIGTGCGLIALMLAQKLPEAAIDAIELDEPSFNEAAYNFTNSKYTIRLKAHHISLQQFNSTIKYDLIVSNPPYFEIPNFSKGNNTQDISESRKKLATQFTLTFEELVASTMNLLNVDGRFWVIIPFDAKDKFIKICLEQNLYLQNEISVRSKPGFAFHRSVLGFGFNEKRNLENSELTIYNVDGTRHEEYIELTEMFYL